MKIKFLPPESVSRIMEELDFIKKSMHEKGIERKEPRIILFWNSKTSRTECVPSFGPRGTC